MHHRSDEPDDGAAEFGSALARSARWNRVPSYLAEADRHVSLFVQVETFDAVTASGEIASVPGVDGVFIGPSDLAASMGAIGQQTCPDVLAAVRRAFAAVMAAGKPVGLNAFDPATARDYLADGVSFILVGADVTLLARGAESLAAAYVRRDP